MTHLVKGLLGMEHVIDIRTHDAWMQMQISLVKSPKFVKHPAGRGQAEREDFPLLNNELACRIPEGKSKIPPMRWVFRNMKIVILQIQQHHSPTLMESLKYRQQGLHVELRNVCLYV